MKSIKEKAQEYSHTKGNLNEYYNSAGEWLDFDPIGYTQRTYEDGANYVLEEIEKVIYSNSSCEKAIFELGKLVIQLKK